MPELVKCRFCDFSDKAIRRFMQLDCQILRKSDDPNPVRLMIHKGRESGTWEVLRGRRYIPVGVWPQTSYEALRELLVALRE